MKRNSSRPNFAAACLLGALFPFASVEAEPARDSEEKPVILQVPHSAAAIFSLPVRVIHDHHVRMTDPQRRKSPVRTARLFKLRLDEPEDFSEVYEEEMKSLDFEGKG